MSRGLRRYGADRLTGQVLDFEGLTPEMRQDLAVRLRMLGGVRRRMTWIQFILALGFHIEDEMAEAGLSSVLVVTQELPLIDLHKLERLHINTRRPMRVWSGDKEGGLEILAPTPYSDPPPPPSLHSQHYVIEDERASGQTYHPFDNTLVGSSGLSFQRCVRPMTGDASTPAAPHTDAQLDP
ncbi:hypothetical protein Tco_0796540 [Tanacetum coccineum]